MTLPSSSPSSPDSTAPRSERILYVPVDQLDESPHAPSRVSPSPKLIESLKTFGVLQPLIVRRQETGYELLTGFKRFEAAKRAGLTEVPVRVFRVDDPTVSQLQDACNLGSGGRVSLPSSPPSPSGRPRGGSLGGLLEEELSQPGSRTGYKPVLLIAAVVILLIWPIVIAMDHFGKDKGDDSEDAGTELVAQETPQPTRRAATSPTRKPSAPRSSPWNQAFEGISGIQVQVVNGTPRIVFDQAVFSSITTIDPNQKQRLLSIIAAARARCDSCMIAIIGHTDNDPVRSGGAFSNNRDLAQKRADAVQNFLVNSAGVPASHLRPLAAGMEDAPFPNDTVASKKKNRTVTIEIIVPSN